MDSDSITAIVIVGLPVIVGTGYAAFRAWIKHEERKMELFGLAPNPRAAALVNNSSIANLEAKIKQVRDTSNEYDLSIQHTLDNILKRLDQIEQRSGKTATQARDYTSIQPEQGDVQQNGSGQV